MHTSDVSNIVRLTRQLLEASGSHRRYPTVMLYCNWMLHDKIDRPHNLKILLDVGHFISRYRGDVSTISRELGSVLGLSRLRKEMRQLFVQHHVDASLLIDNQNWSSFAGVLLIELIEVPIEFPFKQWWGETRDRRHNDLKEQLKAMPFLIPLRIEIIEKTIDEDRKAPLVQISCDGAEGSGWVTDETHYIKLRIPLPIVP